MVSEANEKTLINIAPTTQPMIPATTHGKQGDEIEFFGSSQYYSSTQQMRALAHTMKSFPRNINMHPNECVTPSLNIFFTTKRKAFQADLQKFLLVRAICIYAFLVMNLMHLSRQANKQEVQHSKNLTTGLSLLAFWIFLLQYSKIILIICTIAMMQLPNAIDPK